MISAAEWKHGVGRGVNLGSISLWPIYKWKEVIYRRYCLIYGGKRHLLHPSGRTGDWRNSKSFGTAGCTIKIKVVLQLAVDELHVRIQILHLSLPFTGKRWICHFARAICISRPGLRRVGAKDSRGRGAVRAFSFASAGWVWRGIMTGAFWGCRRESRARLARTVRKSVCGKKLRWRGFWGWRLIRSETVQHRRGSNVVCQEDGTWINRHAACRWRIGVEHVQRLGVVDIIRVIEWGEAIFRRWLHGDEVWWARGTLRGTGYAVWLTRCGWVWVVLSLSRLEIAGAQSIRVGTDVAALDLRPSQSADRLMDVNRCVPWRWCGESGRVGRCQEWRLQQGFTNLSCELLFRCLSFCHEEKGVWHYADDGLSHKFAINSQTRGDVRPDGVFWSQPKYPAGYRYKGKISCTPTSFGDSS